MKVEFTVEAMRVHPGLLVEAQMTPEQMKGALESFLQHITDREWREWVKEFAADILAEERAAGAEAARGAA